MPRVAVMKMTAASGSVESSLASPRRSPAPASEHRNARRLPDRQIRRATWPRPAGHGRSRCGWSARDSSIQARLCGRSVHMSSRPAAVLSTAATPPRLNERSRVFPLRRRVHLPLHVFAAAAAAAKRRSAGLNLSTSARRRRPSDAAAIRRGTRRARGAAPAGRRNCRSDALQNRRLGVAPMTGAPARATPNEHRTEQTTKRRHAEEQGRTATRDGQGRILHQKPDDGLQTSRACNAAGCATSALLCARQSSWSASTAPRSAP